MAQILHIAVYPLHYGSVHHDQVNQLMKMNSCYYITVTGDTLKQFYASGVDIYVRFRTKISFAVYTNYVTSSPL